MSLDSFAGKCLIETKCDAEGNPCSVHVSCKFRDRTGEIHHLQRDINLAPIIQMMLPYYSQSDNMDVSGIGDMFKSASKVAASVAKSKAVKQVYNVAKKVDWDKAKQLALVVPPPYGTAAAAAIQAGQTGAKIYNTVQAARKGNKSALDVVAQVRAAAEGGDVKALGSLQTMQNMAAMLREKEAGAPPRPTAVPPSSYGPAQAPVKKPVPPWVWALPLPLLFLL